MRARLRSPRGAGSVGTARASGFILKRWTFAAACVAAMGCAPSAASPGPDSSEGSQHSAGPPPTRRGPIPESEGPIPETGGSFTSGATSARSPSSGKDGRARAFARRDALQAQRDAAARPRGPSKGAAQVCASSTSAAVRGTWSTANGTAGGIFSSCVPQYALVARWEGGSSGSEDLIRVRVEVHVSEWGPLVETKVTGVGVYSQQTGCTQPVTRLHELRTSDRIGLRSYFGETAHVEVEVEPGEAYVVVAYTPDKGEAGEGKFELRVNVMDSNSEGGTLELWDMPPVERIDPSKGFACTEALARHALVQGSQVLYQTCPVDEIMEELSDGSFFVDAAFPPVPASVNLEPESKQAVSADSWARFEEFATEPQLMAHGGVDPDDVIQGRIGNCWFVACLAALALVPELAQSLIYPPWYNPRGVYGVRIWHDNAWRWVIVDDWVPTSNEPQPRFIRSRSGNDLWMVVLEKAFAKLHGCYAFMRGSYCAEKESPWTRSRYTALGSSIVLTMLTGGESHYTSIDNRHGNFQEVFDRARELANSGGIMTLGTRDSCDSDDSGLVPGHAYSIVRVAVTHCEGPFQLVQCRNTWGSSEWKLKWADDDSKSWTPDLARELSLVRGDDGIFWMEASDFYHRFESLNVTKVVPDNFPEAWDAKMRTLEVEVAARDEVDAAKRSARQEEEEERKLTELRGDVVGFSAPPPQMHRILVKGRWESDDLCGGLGSLNNPQICIPLHAPQGQGAGTIESVRVTLGIPFLLHQRGFSALLGLSVYLVPVGTPLDGLNAASSLADHAGLGLWEATSVHVGLSTGTFDLVVDLPCGSDAMEAAIVVPEISPPAGGEGGLNAPFTMLVQASFPLTPRRLERPPDPVVTAGPTSGSAGRFRLSASAEIARVKEKRAQHDEAKRKVKSALSAFGLRERAKAMSAATSAALGIALPGDGHVPYALLPHLTPELGYPPAEMLRPASIGLLGRVTPGVSLAVSHVVAGLGEDERSIALLRAPNGTCFVPLHSTVSVVWDFVPGDILALGGEHREKHRGDMLLLMATDQTADDVDCAGGCSVSLDRGMAQDSAEVSLPEELEFGVAYEFRYFSWRANSVHGDFTGFRSQPFRVLPRAGLDTDGWIAIVSDVEEDLDAGVVRVAQGRDVRVEWDISDLAGITQASRDYFLENGTKNYEDFIAVYDVNELDVDNYAYYFDVPDAEEEDDDDDESVSRSARAPPTSMNLEWYYLENYCAEPGIKYVLRYVREKVAVAQSLPFVVPVPSEEE